MLTILVGGLERHVRRQKMADKLPYVSTAATLPSATDGALQIPRAEGDEFFKIVGIRHHLRHVEVNQMHLII